MGLPCEVDRGPACPSGAEECLFDDPASPECRPSVHKPSSWHEKNPRSVRRPGLKEEDRNGWAHRSWVGPECIQTSVSGPNQAGLAT